MRKIITGDNYEYLADEISYDILLNNIETYDKVIIQAESESFKNITFIINFDSDHTTIEPFMLFTDTGIEDKNIIDLRSYNTLINYNTNNTNIKYNSIIRIKNYNINHLLPEKLNIYGFLNIIQQCNKENLTLCFAFDPNSIVLIYFELENNVKKSSHIYYIDINSIKYYIPLKQLNQ